MVAEKEDGKDQRRHGTFIIYNANATRFPRGTVVVGLTSTSKILSS